MGKKVEISPFYLRLEAACKKKCVKVAQMASDCGLSSSAAYKWKGDTVPYGKTLQTIATYLGVTSEYLLSGGTSTIPHSMQFGDEQNATLPTALTPTEERLWAALEVAQSNMKIMAESNALLARTNSELGAWAAQQIGEVKGVEMRGTSQRSAKGKGGKP